MQIYNALRLDKIGYEVYFCNNLTSVMSKTRPSFPV